MRRARVPNSGVSEQDKVRMLDLLAKQQRGHITTEERDELKSYIQTDNVLSMLKAKALLARRRAEQES